MEKTYVTMESFGSELPANWEQAMQYLNVLIDNLPQDENGEIDREDVDTIWENYCSGLYDDMIDDMIDGEDSNMYTVNYECGENRNGKPVDYMMVVGGVDELDGDDLYCEVEIKDEDMVENEFGETEESSESDDRHYAELKRMVIRKAVVAGLVPDKLEFFRG